MKHPFTIHPGRARDVFEADLHARLQRCPACGGVLTPLFETPLSPPFALRLQHRCGRCELAVFFDYLPGPDWQRRGGLGPLELAASPEPSSILTAAQLEGLVREGVRELDQAEARRPAGPVEAQEQEAQRLDAASNALQALWELEKLPGAPADLTFARNRALERRLLEVYAALGGLVPPALAARFSSPGARTPPAFHPLWWAMSYFAAPEAFARAPVVGASEHRGAGLRAAVGRLLERLARELAGAAAAAGGQPRLAGGPQPPIAVYDALGLAREVELAIAGTGDLAALEARWAATLDAFFSGLRAWQQVLVRAHAFATSPARAGLPPSAALDHVDAAAFELPAWPLALATLERRASIDAMLGELGVTGAEPGARRGPGPLRVVHPGRARDAFEVDRHSRSQRCLVCGGGLVPRGERPLAPPFAERRELACAVCATPVWYDYLRGWCWSTRAPLSALEQARAAEPSVLLPAAHFEQAVRHALAELKRLASLPSGEERARILASSGLQALWELEKLPDAPADLRWAEAGPVERALRDAYLAANGPVPPSLAAAFAPGAPRRAPAFHPLSWAMSWFVDRAAFERAPLPVPDQRAAELRFVVGSMLELIERGLARAAGGAGALGGVQVPAPRPIVVFDALGLGQRLEALIANLGKDAAHLVVPELEGYRAIDGYFAALEAHHALLRGGLAGEQPVWPLHFAPRA